MPDIRLTTRVAATPTRVYATWIDAEGHAAMTGAPATSEARVGGRYTAWGGYIEGEYVALEPGRRIEMRWRTSEFPEGHAGALVVIELVEDGDGTALTLTQSDTPPDQIAAYESGWNEYYFSPMQAHFRG